MLAEVVDIAEVAEALTIQLLFQYLCIKKSWEVIKMMNEWMMWMMWMMHEWYEYFYCWVCDKLPFKIEDKQVTLDSIGQQAEKFAKLPW